MLGRRLLPMACSVAFLVFLGAGIAEAQQIRPGSTQGRLEAGDQTLRTGEYLDVYTFQGQAGDEVRIDLLSPEFDAYLILTAPSGAQQENDDFAPPATDARISTRLLESGPFRIGVTSYKPCEVGNYEVRFRVSPRPAPPPGTPPPMPHPGCGDILSPGQTARGQLQCYDDTMPDGRYVHWYTIRARRGQQVRLHLSSQDFDTYLILEAPSSLRTENDDISKGNTDSEITSTLAENGDYRVGVTSYRVRSTGSYTLTFELMGGCPPPRVPPPQVPPPQTPPPPQQPPPPPQVVLCTHCGHWHPAQPADAFECFTCRGQARIICGTCHGSGRTPCCTSRTCGICHGTGWRNCHQCNGTGTVVCPACRGQGCMHHVQQVR